MKFFYMFILIILFSISTLFSNSSFAQENQIPFWIKNNANWWANDQISDTDFLKGIEFLINKKILLIPQTSSDSNLSESEIPEWIKNNALWWSQGKISDQDFVLGIQYLIKSNLIKVNMNIIFGETNLPLMIPILNDENPDSELTVIKKFLKSGDILVFPPQLYQKVTQIQKEITDIELGTGGTSTQNLLPGISRIPPNVKYVTYDYEPDFTPEWTDDQKKSIELFTQLHEETKKYNKKLVIVPVYHFGQDWDWGEVAKHTDVLVVQVQNYQKGGKFPAQFIPNESLTEITKKLVKQVDAKSPTTKLYLQIGFAFGSKPNDVISDINEITNLGIDGFTLWYNPGTSGKTSKFEMLQETLENLER